jgi:hypothetical protein
MKKLNIIIGFLLFISCSPTGTLSVKNVQDITELGNHAFVYSLPHTRISVQIKAIREYTIPGKYNKYAEKYLSIKDVPVNPVINWKIENIKLESLCEPDPEYFFAIETNKTDYLLKNVLQLKEEGLILKVDESNPFIQYLPDLKNMQQLDINPDLTAIENTNNKKVEVPIDLPVGKPKEEIKSEEQKVQQAANFIFKIRKRRFKLLAGEYDSTSIGSSLQTSVNELNRLEQEYLSLFIGKTYIDTLKHTFYYIPKSGLAADRFVFCRFSEFSGFEDGASSEGKPIIIELQDLQNTAPLEHLEMPPAIKGNNNCILYRIPDKASVHIYFGSVPVLEGEIKVFQYGAILPYCIDIIDK